MDHRRTLSRRAGVLERPRLPGARTRLPKEVVEVVGRWRLGDGVGPRGPDLIDGEKTVAGESVGDSRGP